MSRRDEAHVNVTAAFPRFTDAMRRAGEAAKGFVGYWNDRALTRLVPIQPCHEGDHETVLPCPVCKAAI